VFCDLIPEFRMVFERAADGIRNRLAGGIVHRWTQSAGGDDDIRSLQRLMDRFCDPPGIITDGLCPEQVNAQAAQDPGNKAGIGVRRFPEQELSTYGDNLSSGHGWIIKQKGRLVAAPP